MASCKRLYDIFKMLFLDHSVQAELINLLALSLAVDGTPVYTAAQERKNVPVTVSNMASGTASATVSIASLTVTSVGTPTESAGISAMIGTCSLPLIRKTPCLFSLSLAPLPVMIPLVSFIIGFP